MCTGGVANAWIYVNVLLFKSNHVTLVNLLSCFFISNEIAKVNFNFALFYFINFEFSLWFVRLCADCGLRDICVQGVLASDLLGSVCLRIASVGVSVCWIGTSASVAIGMMDVRWWHTLEWVYEPCKR